MKLISHFKSVSGQALTSLLIIITIGMSAITLSSSLINSSLFTTSQLLEANDAYVIAESGVEVALLKILRNPNYTGETIDFDLGSAQVTVPSTSPFTLVSRGTSGHHQRSIQVIIYYNDGIMTVDSWKEI